MPLRKQLIEAPLSSGLGQKTDIRSLQVDGAAVMTNCVRAKSGSIHKRFGCKQLPVVMRRTGGVAINEFQAVRGINYGAAPIILDGWVFSQWSDARQSFDLIDATPEAVADQRIPIAGINGVGGDLDFCPSLNYYIVAIPVIVSSTLGVSGVNAVIVDATSGAIVSSTLLASGGIGLPRVAVCGTTAIIGWELNTGTTGMYLSKVDLTSTALTWSAPSLFDATDSLNGFDIVAMAGDPTKFILAYFVAGPSTKVNIVTASTLVAANTFTKAIVTVGAPASIAVEMTTGEWGWVAYGVRTGAIITFEAWAYQPAATTIAVLLLANSASIVGFAQVGIARVSSTDAVVFMTTYTTTAGSPPFLNAVLGQQVTATAGGNTVGNLRQTNGVMLASKPAVLTTPIGTRCYSMVNTNSSLQGTQALVCYDFFGSGSSPFGSGAATDVPARLVATIAPRISKNLGVSAGGLGPGGQLVVPKLVPISATKLATLIYVSETTQSSGVFIQTFDFGAQVRFFGNTLSGSNSLGLSAGAPFTFDEQTPSEMGFLWYPEAITTSFIGGGALTGAYSYIVTYEWVDAIGNVHRSGTSPPVNVVPSAQTVHLVLPVLGVTWRQRHAPSVVNGTSIFQNTSQLVKICIYRTTASGTTYYFLASIDNDTSVPTVSYNDVTTDSTLTSNRPRLIYTTGGVLDNFCPPSAKICITHKNRWWLAGCDDSAIIWPSKAFTSGEIPGFNEQFNIEASGPVTALASLDEKLIIFVQRGNNSYGIEYIIGEGPFDTGASNNWTDPPQPLPHAVGAIDQRSIAVCELGVFFFSPVGGTNGQGGIFLLSRDLQVTYVSGAVEDTIAAFPVCTGAAVHPNAGRIYFEFSANDTLVLGTLGRRLVYDYLAQCWSTDTHYQFNGAFEGAAARTTFVAGGQGVTGAGSVNMPLMHWVDYAGQVYRETSGFQGTNQFLDVSVGGAMQWITSAFTSAWFKPALSGFARFWRVQVQSDTQGEVAGLALNVQFDYAPAVYYTEGNSWTSTQIAAFDRAPICDVEHLVGNQKAKAIQVTLVDLPPVVPSSTARGFSWATISIEMGVEDGGRYQNLPAGQRG